MANRTWTIGPSLPCKLVQVATPSGVEAFTVGREYRGRVVFAFGCYDCGELNPTVLSASFDGLDDSPWLYDALGDFLEAFTPGESGAVLEWTGTLRNYRFKGSTRTILNATKGDPQ